MLFFAFFYVKKKLDKFDIDEWPIGVAVIEGFARMRRLQDGLGEIGNFQILTAVTNINKTILLNGEYDTIWAAVELVGENYTERRAARVNEGRRCQPH